MFSMPLALNSRLDEVLDILPAPLTKLTIYSGERVRVLLSFI